MQLNGRAQKTGQALIDSVLSRLPDSREDTNKVKAFAKIGECYLYLEPANGINYVKKGLELSEKLEYKRGISRMENLLGLLVGDTGNNTLAREYFNRSYEVNKKIDNAFGMISNLNNIGRTYQRESDYASARDYFLKALAVADEINNHEQIALVGTNLTASYYAQKDYTKAMEYAVMTLKHAQLANSPNNIGKALFEIGSIKQDTKDSAGAVNFFEQAFQVYKKMDNKSAMAQVMVEKATLSYPNYAKAISEMQQTQVILDNVSPSTPYSIANLSNLGNSFYELSRIHRGDKKKADLNTGESYLNRAMAICRETGNKEYLASIFLTLSQIKEAENNYPAALEDFKSYFSINDSLFSQDKKNQLAALESRNKIGLKDRELAINKLELANQRRTLLGMVVGLILLGIIGCLLIWQNRIRKKSNEMLVILNTRLDEANKIKAKFFGILSHDLRSPVASLVNYLYLLKNEPDQISVEENIASRQQISQSAEELLQTMETILLWSKEQMDHFKPEIKLIPVSFLFDHLHKFFPSSGDLTIIFSNPDGLNVTADENYLKVIMQNLTSNAIKALRNQSPGFIEWKAANNGEHTILTITDNGPGIPPNKIKTIFSDDTVVNSNTGFGFRIIRDLAEAIQYRITVESLPGKGTTFKLSNSIYL